MKRAVLGTLAIVGLCSVSMAAQWPKHTDAGVPRDAKGAVRMNGPAPRTPDGKPSLAGNWRRADREPLPTEIAGIVGDRGEQGGRSGRPAGIPVEPEIEAFPPDPKSPPVATFFELGGNIPGGLPFTPWAAQIRKQRMA